MMDKQINLAILASGSGTNAENITKYFDSHSNIQVKVILSNKSDAFVHERARNLNIPSSTFSKAEFQDTSFIKKLADIDYIILAGFLWLIPRYLIKAFSNKIINIHPALLPKFGGKGMYGERVHKAVIYAGEKESGITIHLVNEEYDKGKILFQAKCQVEAGDTPEVLAQKIHTLEHKHFPKVIEEYIVTSAKYKTIADGTFAYLEINQPQNMSTKKIQSALISVFHKDGLEPIVRKLDGQGVKIYSTGGTEKFIKELGIDVIPVESLTDYPSIFGGRVKTLHPKVFGGILHRRDNESDLTEAKKFEIPPIDLVIVDLYPFEETVASGAGEEDIIEKIDIGGIALIRAGAKNYKDVVMVSSRAYYQDLQDILDNQNGETTEEERKLFAAKAFATSSHYDSAIFNWMNGNDQLPEFRVSSGPGRVLRYGENPHQKGTFYGDLSEYFDQLHGKEISYNNLVDIEAAVQLMAEFDETAFGILKHNNACGIATGTTVKEAYLRSFAADTVSAFGGVLVSNKEIGKDTAEEMNSLFFEILIAPSFSSEALTVLKTKKNRILLVQKKPWHQETQYKSLLNGTIVQDYDLKSETKAELEVKTQKAPTADEVEDLIFASKVCKQSKSNTIVLAKDGQLLASGVGQTSRVDALNQAIEKAGKFGFNLNGSVMASDAFFPFPDCVEIAHKAGISAVIQPGGSIKDQDSIDYCDANGLAMVMTGTRHFKH